MWANSGVRVSETRALTLPFLGLTAALWLASFSAARAQVDEPDLAETQVAAILERAEVMLKKGNPERAYRTIAPLSAVFLSSASQLYVHFWELWRSATAISATAAVRLKGIVPRSEGSLGPTKELENAEKRLRELLDPDWLSKMKSEAGEGPQASIPGSAPPAFYASRHAEALVALGRHTEAYSLLAPMLTNGTLSEPEAAAALASAAHAGGHTEVYEAALKRCVTIAKQRAKQVCRRQ